MNSYDLVWLSLAIGAGLTLAVMIFGGALARLGGVRWFFRGYFGEDIGGGARRRSGPRGAAATDRDRARAFVTDVRTPGDRVVVAVDDMSVRLDERGTHVMTALVSSDSRLLRRAARRVLNLDAWLFDAESRRSDLTNQDAQAGAVAAAYRRTRGAVTLSIGGASVELTRTGSAVAIGLLIGDYRAVNRIAHALGAEGRDGWSDWLPSDRQVDVPHDYYLDVELNGWTVGRRPTFGGKRQRRPR